MFYLEIIHKQTHVFISKIHRSRSQLVNPTVVINLYIGLKIVNAMLSKSRSETMENNKNKLLVSIEYESEFRIGYFPVSL
jgi:hypothetical protein